MKSIHIIFFLALMVATSLAQAQTSVDPERSEVQFTILNLGEKVEGKAKGLTGQINFNADNLANSQIAVAVPVKKIRTGDKMRDEHLQESDFFDAGNHSKLLFLSQSIRKEGEIFLAKGELNIKGVIKEVEISFKEEGQKFTGSFTLNRADFGVGGQEEGDAIGLEVQVSFVCYVKE